MSVSPLQNQQTSLVSYKVFIDGNELDSQKYDVYSVECSHEINKIGRATVYILDGSTNKEKFEYKDKELNKMEPGKTIKVQVGYQTAASTTIFEGIIVQVGVSIRDVEHSMVALECADKAVKMSLDRVNKVFVNKKDSDIMQELIGKYGIDADVKATDYKHKRVLQYHCSDWDFLVARAELNGRVVINVNNKIKVAKPCEDNSKPVKVKWGEEIVKSSLVVNGKTQLKKVKASAWNMKEQKIEYSESSENIPELGSLQGPKLANDFISRTSEIHSTCPLEKPLLKIWADAKLSRSRLSKVTGTLLVQGVGNVKPDQKLKIEKIGSAFDGDAYISRVFHEIRGGNWLTDLSIGLTQEWFTENRQNVQSANAGGVTPGISGIYNGKVLQMHNDEDGELRVKINLPVMDGSEVWARLSNLYASNGFGTFFMPNVGDEVLVGFLHGNPDYPIILGSLYSSQKLKSPYDADSDNSIQAIVTKNKLRLIFEDKKKNLICETPGGRRMTLSDEKNHVLIEDPYGNSIKMDSSGIKIEASRGKVEISGMNEVTMESKTNKVNIDAMMDINISAKMNVSVSGMLQGTFKGTVSTTLGSGACPMTTVSGIMVSLG